MSNGLHASASAVVGVSSLVSDSGSTLKWCDCTGSSEWRSVMGFIKHTEFLDDVLSSSVSGFGEPLLMSL